MTTRPRLTLSCQNAFTNGCSVITLYPSGTVGTGMRGIGLRIDAIPPNANLFYDLTVVSTENISLNVQTSSAATTLEIMYAHGGGLAWSSLVTNTPILFPMEAYVEYTFLVSRSTAFSANEIAFTLTGSFIPTIASYFDSFTLYPTLISPNVAVSSDSYGQPTFQFTNFQLPSGGQPLVLGTLNYCKQAGTVNMSSSDNGIYLRAASDPVTPNASITCQMPVNKPGEKFTGYVFIKIPGLGVNTPIDLVATSFAPPVDGYAASFKSRRTNPPITIDNFRESDEEKKLESENNIKKDKILDFVPEKRAAPPHDENNDSTQADKFKKIKF